MPIFPLSLLNLCRICTASKKVLFGSSAKKYMSISVYGIPSIYAGNRLKLNLKMIEGCNPKKEKTQEDWRKTVIVHFTKIELIFKPIFRNPRHLFSITVFLMQAVRLSDLQLLIRILACDLNGSGDFQFGCPYF